MRIFQRLVLLGGHALSRTVPFGLIFATLLLQGASRLHADNLPRTDEMSYASQWVGARFGGELPTPKTSPSGLYVVANNDSVQKSKRNGQSFVIGGITKQGGLYCYAVSRIVVYADAPVERFTAEVGVDSNSHTSGGRGSIVFVVKKIESNDSPSGKMLLGELKETELYRSGKIVEGMKPLPIDIDLNGTTAFVLEIEDAGDGISCDQSVWADAKITMKNSKKTVALDEMPFQTLRGTDFSTLPPFSFMYGGVSSFELLPKWNLKKSREKIDENRVRHHLQWTDPKTKLVIKCEVVEYLDYPTVEWVVRFKNTGTENTPIISDIRSVDIVMDAEVNQITTENPWQKRNLGAPWEIAGGPISYRLHHATGSPCRADDFQPLETQLTPGTAKTIATSGGRSTNASMPYFNVQRENEGGLIVVIGWPGQWSAHFDNNTSTGMKITGGQELTRFTLYPGEEVRAPMTVLQFWSGNDRLRSQNIWRRWMLAYGTPHPNGKVVQPHFAACSSHQFNEMINATDKTQINFIDRYLEEGVKLDYWWMDAGWYIMKNTNSWPETGTWEVDKRRFPNGLRAVSDHAHAKDVNIIVWFEPERVHSGTWLTENHPEWVLGGKNGGLLNLGNPEAWNWLVNHIDSIITDEKIDLYRQDFNMDPLGHWRANDTEDRQGITEIKHVMGYLAYWDELIRRHPGMLIDTCASGGRRLDIETLRRSVSLLRSDFIFNPTGNQCHTYGLSFWIPIFGSGTIHSAGSSIAHVGSLPDEPYVSRSVVIPFINSCADVRVPANPATNVIGSADYNNLRRYYDDWKQAAPFFYGDFYPLTPYTLEEKDWIGWQFDLPEENKGMLQVFRRRDSIFEAARFPLSALDPDANYVVQDIDKGVVGTFSGKELMQNGLRVTMEQKPEAVIFFYSKTK